jgi:hypothetical protein
VVPKKKHPARRPSSSGGRRTVAADRLPTYEGWVSRVRGDGPSPLSPGVLAMFVEEALATVEEKTGLRPRHSLTEADVDVVVAWLDEVDDGDPLLRVGTLAGLATFVDYLVETRQWPLDVPDASAISGRLRALALPGDVSTTRPSARDVVIQDREPLGSFHDEFTRWVQEQPQAPDFGHTGQADPAQIVDLALEEMVDRDTGVTANRWPTAVLGEVLEQFPVAVAQRQGQTAAAAAVLRDSLARVMLKYLAFLTDADRWNGSAEDLAGSFALLRSVVGEANPSNSVSE